MANRIEISKIFKGEQKEFIEIVTEGGTIGDDSQFLPDGIHFSIGNEGVFFCRYYTGKGNFFLTLSTFKGFIQYFFDKYNPNAVDGQVAYSNIKMEVYDKIIQSAQREAIKIKNNTFEQNLQDVIEDNFDVLALTETLIYFTFENAELNADNDVEFDIFAQASIDGITFSSTDIYLQFSQEAFGSNAVANGRIEVTKEIIIENEVYTKALADDSPQVVQLLINSGVEISELYPLSLTPEKFCHVKIAVENIWALANISFDDFAMANQSIFYDASSGEYVTFDKIIVSDPVFPFLEPNITSFEGPDANNPYVVHAGVGEILTIHGNNFGTYDPAVSKVTFRDGDGSFTTISAVVENGDIVRDAGGNVMWSDDIIQVYVPSTTNTSPTNINKYHYPAGSGKFKVTNANGETGVSVQSIEVPYAILNQRYDVNKPALKIGLPKLDNEGITFTFPSGFPFGGSFISTLEKWCLKTHIGFYYHFANTTFQAACNDNINSVTMEEPSIIDGNPASVVIDCTAVCVDNNGITRGFMMKGLDIKIEPSLATSGDPDIAQKIKNILLHELGHAQMLTHAIKQNGGTGNLQYCMYPDQCHRQNGDKYLLN